MHRYTISICIGHLEFVGEKCSSGEILEGHNLSNVSAAIPCYEVMRYVLEQHYNYNYST